jgi:hypothetical protein
MSAHQRWCSSYHGMECDCSDGSEGDALRRRLGFLVAEAHAIERRLAAIDRKKPIKYTCNGD